MARQIVRSSCSPARASRCSGRAAGELPPPRLIAGSDEFFAQRRHWRTTLCLHGPAAVMNCAQGRQDRVDATELPTQAPHEYA